MSKTAILKPILTLSFPTRCWGDETLRKRARDPTEENKVNTLHPVPSKFLQAAQQHPDVATLHKSHHSEFVL